MNYVKKEEIGVKDLLPLAKYLFILVDTFPEPIRAKVLAEKTGHSKAAISKIRERLLQICDPRPMLLQKGFILSQNLNNLPAIFIVHLAHGEHRRFLSSSFFKILISSKRIHEKLSLAVPYYGSRFSEEDTGFLIKKLVETVERLPPKDFEFLLRVLTSRKPSTYQEFLFSSNLQKNLKKLQFSFNHEEELIKTIVLRDKFFFLIRDTLWTKVEEMDILKTFDDKNRANYKTIYKTTIDFYLRKIFSNFNESLIKAGKKYFKKDIDKKIQIGASHLKILQK